MKQAKVLTADEWKRVLAVIAARRHAARDRLAFMVSHYGGLRVGEIAGLTIGDVFDEAGKPRDRVHLKRYITKGGFARTIFANTRLRRELAQYAATLSTLPAPHAPLIRSQKGRAFSANTLCQLFIEIYAKAGISGASSHSGRRGFITKLAHSGVSPKVIMELAGHRHLSTTQRYIDVTDDMKQQAVERL